MDDTVKTKTPPLVRRPSDAGLYFKRRADMPAALVARLEELAYRHGKSYDSYLVMEPKYRCFFMADGSGAVCFVPRYGFHAVGGLLAADADKAALLDAFADFCKRRWRRSLIYNIDEADAPLLASRGYELTKWGEDPVIDLQTVDWRGRKYEWVRRQENFGQRHGLLCREIGVGQGEDWPRLKAVLEALSEGHIKRSAHGRELGTFQGSLNLDHFNRRKLFVAELADGTIEGLVVCNPSHDGQRWSFEIYRRSETAPRGTVPFIFMQAMRMLAAQGYKEASLSLIPALNCEQQREAHSRVFVWMLGLWWNRFSWVFDLQGIYHFKSRFRPRYDARYIAARPHFGLVQCYTLAVLWGVLLPNPKALARNIGEKIRKRGARATLAAPDAPDEI